MGICLSDSCFRWAIGEGMYAELDIVDCADEEDDDAEEEEEDEEEEEE